MPIGLSVNVGAMTISWTNVADEVEFTPYFEIIITSGGVAGEPHKVATETGTTLAGNIRRASIAGLGLAQGTVQHRARVRAIADPDSATHKDSELSDQTGAFTIDLTPFTKPTGVTVNRETLMLNWTAVENADRYVVTINQAAVAGQGQRTWTREVTRPTTGTPPVPTGVPPTSLDLWSAYETHDWRLVAGRSYTITVSAHRIDPGTVWGISEPSDSVTVNLLPNGALNVVDIANINTATWPTLTFNAVAGAEAYVIEAVGAGRSTVFVPTPAVAAGNPVTFNLSDFRLAPGADTIRIRARGRAALDSAWSATNHATNGHFTALAHADAPSAVTVGEGNIVSWTASPTGGQEVQRIEVRAAGALANDWREAGTRPFALGAHTFDLTNYISANLSGGVHSVRVVATYATGTTLVPTARTAASGPSNLTFTQTIAPFEVTITDAILTWTHNINYSGGYSLWFWQGAFDSRPVAPNAGFEARVAPAADQWFITGTNNHRSFDLTSLNPNLGAGTWNIQMQAFGATAGATNPLIQTAPTGIQQIVIGTPIATRPEFTNAAATSNPAISWTHASPPATVSYEIWVHDGVRMVMVRNVGDVLSFNLSSLPNYNQLFPIGQARNVQIRAIGADRWTHSNLSATPLPFTRQP
jgi:hypothetical protein